MLADLAKAKRAFEAITPRQKAVLDLVVEHRTSKEIARDLGIAPNTVDQRINAVRDRLGARDRAEVARIYVQLRDICGETTCGSSVLASELLLTLPQGREVDLSPVFTLNDAAAMSPESWVELKQIDDLGAKFSENRLWRLVMIVGIAIGVAVVTVTVLAIMNAVNALV